MRIKKWLISKGQFIISTKNFSLAGKSKKKYWKYVNPVVKIKFGRKLGWVHIHTHFVSVITYYKKYNQKCCKIPAPPSTQYYSKYRHFHFKKVQLRSFLCPNEHLIVWKYIVQYTYIWYKKNHFRFRTWQ